MATLRSVGMCVLLAVGIGAAFSVEVFAQEESITSSVIAAGAERSTGSSFIVSSTIGQPSIGVMAGAANQAQIGFWYTLPQSSISAVELQQNSGGGEVAVVVIPNPSTTYAVVDYAVRSQGRVVVRLYNSLGRLVRTVFDGEESSGPVSRRIDVSTLESGAYRLEIESGDVRNGVIMTVIK